MTILQIPEAVSLLQGTHFQVSLDDLEFLNMKVLSNIFLRRKLAGLHLDKHLLYIHILSYYLMGKNESTLGILYLSQL